MDKRMRIPNANAHSTNFLQACCIERSIPHACRPVPRTECRLTQEVTPCADVLLSLLQALWSPAVLRVVCEKITQFAQIWNGAVWPIYHCLLSKVDETA
jgi:hypothetical protein